MKSQLPLNSTCPWSGDPVSEDSLFAYRGATIGFCNPGCRDKFQSAVSHFDAAFQAANILSPMKLGFVRLAHYNRWMNHNIYGVVSNLDEQAYKRDQGAFFTSIHGTLNHILVWDTTWLQRFLKHDISYPSLESVQKLIAPTSHDQILHEEFADLSTARIEVDDLITAFIGETQEDDYSTTFTYHISTGQAYNKNFGGMIQHLFNHQTHHRGQVTALLMQQGLDPGVTDLLATLPDLEGEE